MFDSQQEYEAYYAPQAKARRLAEASARRDKVVAMALALHEAGDHEGARIMLFDAGIEYEAVGL